MDADLLYIYDLAFAFLFQTLIYMAFPTIILLINVGRAGGRFEKKKAKKIALWNSIIVGAIFFILNVMSENTRAWTPLPAMLYYYINCAMLTDKTKG